MDTIFFIFIFLLIKINKATKNNPIFLTNSAYPILLSSTSDNYNYVITSEKSLKISRENGKVVSDSDSKNYNQNYIYMYDLSHNNYIYIPDKYYLIKYNPFLSFQEIEVNSISPFSSEAMKNIGSIAQNNEFILYGLNGEYLLFSNQNIDLRVHTKIDGLNEKNLVNL